MSNRKEFLTYITVFYKFWRQDDTDFSEFDAAEAAWEASNPTEKEISVVNNLIEKFIEEQKADVARLEAERAEL